MDTNNKFDMKFVLNYNQYQFTTKKKNYYQTRIRKFMLIINSVILICKKEYKDQ